MFMHFPGMDNIKDSFLMVVMLFFAVFMVLCLVRLITVKSHADRLLAVNMLGSVAIPAILIVSLLQKETFFVDVALIYGLVSFLAVVILSQTYIGTRKEQQEKETQEMAAMRPETEPEDKTATMQERKVEEEQE